MRWLLACAATATVMAHRPLLTKPSCGADFYSPETALEVPDISISWSSSHAATCDARATWAKFDYNDKDIAVYVGVGVPTQERFADIRADALIIGPGLPPLSSEDLASLPEEVREGMEWVEEQGENVGALINRSPDDQSTCDHLTDIMKNESTVKNGRCDFYEPFGGSNSWRVLDWDHNYLPDIGTYYVATWLREHTTGKYGVALGTWKEDFRTPFFKPAPDCPLVFDDYNEMRGNENDIIPMMKCKDLAEGLAAAEIRNPSQREPRVCEGGGEIPVYVMGDTNFGANSYDQCVQTCVLEMVLRWMPMFQKGSCPSQGHSDFVDSKTVTPPGSPMPIDVKLYQQAASVCTAPEVNVYQVGATNFGAADDSQCVQMCMMEFILQWMPGFDVGTCADAGHGSLVEEKTVHPEGAPMPMQVEIFSNDGTSQKTSPKKALPPTAAAPAPAPAAPVCAPPNVDAFAVGETNYGASGPGQCVQMCTMAFVVDSWLPQFIKGTCESTGFGVYKESKNIQPAGSPMAVDVHVFEPAPSDQGGGMPANKENNKRKACHRLRRSHAKAARQCPPNQKQQLGFAVRQSNQGMSCRMVRGCEGDVPEKVLHQTRKACQKMRKACIKAHRQGGHHNPN